MVCSYFKILFLVCKDLGLVCFGIQPFGRERKIYSVSMCVSVCVYVFQLSLFISMQSYNKIVTNIV